jgi:hypothetical protein
MATATAPRTDIYLSVLAGRALTALADLSANSSAWNDRIRSEIESGLEYCQVIHDYEPVRPATGRSQGEQALRRLASDDNRESSAEHPPSECDVVETLLRELLARSRKPEPSELLTAIKFFSRDVGRQGH